MNIIMVIITLTMDMISTTLCITKIKIWLITITQATPIPPLLPILMSLRVEQLPLKEILIIYPDKTSINHLPLLQHILEVVIIIIAMEEVEL